jgi:hypothetical protein
MPYYHRLPPNPKNRSIALKRFHARVRRLEYAACSDRAWLFTARWPIFFHMSPQGI